MADFSPSRISIDSEILQLLEKIARKQGRLSSFPRDAGIELDAESVANVDAVHFSTKLEGNVLSHDQVTLALRSGRLKVRNRDLREVLNYARVRKTVREWSLRNKPFDDTWILQNHASLLQGIVTGRLRGHYREATCVIEDSRSRSIVYVAPDWRDVPALVKGLLRWLRREKKSGASALLLAAQFHYELVTIHPFMDGNGRLARLLTNGILMGGGYEVERYAALEKRHEQDRVAYYLALRTLQSGNYYDIPHEQDIRSWVVYWLTCLLETYDEALGRAEGETISPSHHGSPMQGGRFQKADSLFRRHRKLRASEYADLLGLGRTQAVSDLNALVKAGTLERIGGGRSTVYQQKHESGKR